MLHENFKICEYYRTYTKLIPFTEEQKQEHKQRTGFDATWDTEVQVVYECMKSDNSVGCRCLGCKSICDFKENK